MQSLGEKMKDADLDEMIAEADSDNDGLINYEGKLQCIHEFNTKVRSVSVQLIYDTVSFS